VLRLGGDFGRIPMARPQRDDHDCWTTTVGDLRIRWSGAGGAAWQDGALVADLLVPAGSTHDLVLEVIRAAVPEPVDPDRAWSATEQAWARDVPDVGQSAAPRDARHAYAVLRGLTSPKGGMVAAATLGLPERANQGRNCDYRYVWLRDQAYAGVSCAVDQPYPLLDEALAFCTERLLEHGDRIAPAYRIDGSAVPAESSVQLPGYPGGRNTVGNWVRQQFQLDVLGDVLLLIAAGIRFDRVEKHHLDAAAVAIRVIERRWNEPEAGIWELNDAWWTTPASPSWAGWAPFPKCSHQPKPSRPVNWRT
jgi:GH15 family glucan-1,4-alpha-glucosidase